MAREKPKHESFIITDYERNLIIPIILFFFTYQSLVPTFSMATASSDGTADSLKYKIIQINFASMIWYRIYIWKIDKSQRKQPKYLKLTSPELDTRTLRVIKMGSCNTGLNWELCSTINYMMKMYSFYKNEKEKGTIFLKRFAQTHLCELNHL